MTFRSWLCASALKSNLLDKARESGADAAVIDLEDAVPANAKHTARLALRAHFEKSTCMPIAIRINSLATYAGLCDLMFLLDERIEPDMIVLPKAILPAEVSLATALLEERGLSSVRILAIIETVSSLCALRTLHCKPQRLDGLMFGAADFAADLGIPLEDADLRFVKQEIVLSAHRLGTVAIDSPCFALRDCAQIERETHAARLLGFVGKVAIHPAQIAVINASFTPSPQTVDRARRLVAAARHDSDKAVFAVEDQMVGPPFVKYAEHVLKDQANLAPRSRGC